MDGRDGEAKRFKPGLLAISATGLAGSTVSPAGDGRYDEGMMLDDGDLVVAGTKLVRFSKRD